MRSFYLFIYFIYLFLLVRANRPAPPVNLIRTDVKEAAFKLFCRSAFSFSFLLRQLPVELVGGGRSSWGWGGGFW